MQSASSKMKIRAEIFSVLNKYTKANEKDLLNFGKDIEKLYKIEDKQYLARVLLDEIVSDKSLYSKCCVIFLLNVLEKADIEPCLDKILSDKKIPDERKIHLISILKQKGIYFDQFEIDNYVDNADEIALNGVKNFLTNATDNPEVQIDLLDFYLNINQEEKIALLTSVVEEDIDEDNKINSFSLLSFVAVEKEENDIILNALLNTSSPYAIFGLENYASKTKNNKKILKKIKELKFKNPNFKRNDFVDDTKPYDTSISFVDGMGNFSVVFSRIDKNKQIDALFATINFNKGIVSCIGFYKINIKNYTQILIRLFIDAPLIQVPYKTCASLISSAKKINEKSNYQLPFEFHVWKNLIDDIELDDTNIIEDIKTELKPSLVVNDKTIKTVYNTKVLDTWFYQENEDSEIDTFLNNIKNNDIENKENLDKYIENFINQKLIKNQDFINGFKKRLIYQSYISQTAKFKKISQQLYSIYQNENHLKTLLRLILYKTLDCFFSNTIEQSNEKENRFNKKRKLNFDIDKVINILKVIEKTW